MNRNHYLALAASFSILMSAVFSLGITTGTKYVQAQGGGCSLSVVGDTIIRNYVGGCIEYYREFVPFLGMYVGYQRPCGSAEPGVATGGTTLIVSCECDSSYAALYAQSLLPGMPGVQYIPCEPPPTGGGCSTGACQFSSYNSAGLLYWAIDVSTCGPGCMCSCPPSAPVVAGLTFTSGCMTGAGVPSCPTGSICASRGGDADYDSCCADVDCNDADPLRCSDCTPPPGACDERGGDFDDDGCCGDEDEDDGDPEVCITEGSEECGGPCVWEWTMGEGEEVGTAYWYWDFDGWQPAGEPCPAGSNAQQPDYDGTTPFEEASTPCIADSGGSGTWVKISGECSEGCDCEEPEEDGTDFGVQRRTTCIKESEGCECDFGIDEAKDRLLDKFEQWGFEFPRNDNDPPCFTLSLRMPGADTDTEFQICLDYSGRTEWWASSFEMMRRGLRLILRALIWWKFLSMVLTHLSGN